MGDLKVEQWKKKKKRKSIYIKIEIKLKKKRGGGRKVVNIIIMLEKVA